MRLAVRAIQRFVVFAEDGQRLSVMVDLLIEQQAVVLVLFAQRLAQQLNALPTVGQGAWLA